MLKKLGCIMIMATLLMVTGCGNDSGIMMPLYTSATLKISLPSYNRNIIGTDFVLTLPAGVTPALEADGQTVSAGVVTPSGTWTKGLGIFYTPAAGSNPGSLSIPLGNGGIPQGGEVATVVLKLNGFTIPSASSFAITGGTVIDANSNTITGILLTVSDLKLN